MCTTVKQYNTNDISETLQLALIQLEELIKNLKLPRSVKKAISYRIMGFTETIMLNMAFGTNMSSASTIAMMEMVTKMGLFAVTDYQTTKLANNRKLSTAQTVMVKVAIWRAVAFLDTVAIVTYVTGNVKHALAIAAAELLTKPLGHAGHEYIWERKDKTQVEKNIQKRYKEIKANIKNEGLVKYLAKLPINTIQKLSSISIIITELNRTDITHSVEYMKEQKTNLATLYGNVSKTLKQYTGKVHSKINRLLFKAQKINQTMAPKIKSVRVKDKIKSVSILPHKKVVLEKRNYNKANEFKVTILDRIIHKSKSASNAHAQAKVGVTKTIPSAMLVPLLGSFTRDIKDDNTSAKTAWYNLGNGLFFNVFKHTQEISEHLDIKTMPFLFSKNKLNALTDNIENWVYSDKYYTHHKSILDANSFDHGIHIMGQTMSNAPKKMCKTFARSLVDAFYGVNTFLFSEEHGGHSYVAKIEKEYKYFKSLTVDEQKTESSSNIDYKFSVPKIQPEYISLPNNTFVKDLQTTKSSTGMLPRNSGETKEGYVRIEDINTSRPTMFKDHH